VQTFDETVTVGWSVGDGALALAASDSTLGRGVPQMNRRIVLSVFAFALALPAIACETEKAPDKAADKAKEAGKAKTDKPVEPKADPTKIEPA
jgi:hypothetical protein